MHGKTTDQRRDHRVSVDLLLNKYVGGRPYLAKATNLSRRGLLLHRLFEPSNTSDKIGLQFQVPGDDRVISCAGRVVYHQASPPRQGVVLTHVAPEHQQLIDRFLEHQVGPTEV